MEVKVLRRTYRGRAAVRGNVEGEALVSRTPISFMAGFNTEKGIFIEPGHELEGRSIAGRILVYPYGKGSSGDFARLWRCSKHNVAPVGIINHRAEPIHVQGAIIADIPLVYGLTMDELSSIKTGDYVRIEDDRVIIEPRD